MRAATLWPDLPYSARRDTAATLQLYTQIVGKVRLTLMPWVNHGDFTICGETIESSRDYFASYP